MKGTRKMDTQMVGLGSANDLGVRKAIALVRYVDLQAEYVAEDDDDSESILGGGVASPEMFEQASAKHSRWVDRFTQHREWLLSEMKACSDASLLEHGTNHNVLQTIEQIIDLESEEV